ncbi:MAG: hypothetical protein ACU85E_17370 [Gammaproteobacteria bacterium]
MKINQIRSAKIAVYGLLIGAGYYLSGCAAYSDRAAPVPLPTAFSQHINVQGALLAATPYVDKEKAEEVFGFNIRSAGLLPVRLVIDNQSSMELIIQPQQTFLIDDKEQAWPLLTQSQAHRRVSEEVEIGETIKGAAKPSLMLGAAGAIAGFAVGVLTGKNLGETIAKGAAVGASAGALYGGLERHQKYDDEIRKDLIGNSLRNERVIPGELAYGYLFFPGKDEAESAVILRLGLSVGDTQQIVMIPLFN